MAHEWAVAGHQERCPTHAPKPHRPPKVGPPRRAHNPQPARFGCSHSTRTSRIPGPFRRPKFDPDGTLEPAERQRRAEIAKRLFFARITIKSVKARRRKAGQSVTEEAPLRGPPQSARQPQLPASIPRPTGTRHTATTTYPSSSPTTTTAATTHTATTRPHTRPHSPRIPTPGSTKSRRQTASTTTAAMGCFAATR